MTAEKTAVNNIENNGTQIKRKKEKKPTIWLMWLCWLVYTTSCISKIAGMLNGFCYIGSTLSSYGPGVVADIWGWNFVFYLLLAVCFFICIITGTYLIIKKAAKNKFSL